MAKVIQLPTRPNIGLEIGKCPDCEGEVLVIDYGTDDPSDDEWLGSCCECLAMSYWRKVAGQWEGVTPDTVWDPDAQVVDLFPKGA